MVQNKALCQLKLNQHAEAAETCSRVLRQDPAAVKALFRRAQAYEALNKLQLALTDLREALRIDPKEKAVCRKSAMTMLTIMVMENYWTIQGRGGAIVEAEEFAV